MTDLDSASAPAPPAIPTAASVGGLRIGRAFQHFLLRLWSVTALRTALGAWAMSRVLLIGLTWFGVLFQTTRSNLGGGHPTLTLTDFLGHWWIWDSGWYIIIAQGGYTQPSEVGFFPLYPLLIHGGIALFPRLDPILVAMLISNVGTLLALIAIALLVSHDEASDTAPRYALRALLAYPFALYLFAPYSEGIFLAAAAWAILAARRGWWPLAMLAALLAGLARPFGIVLAAPMLWEFGRQVGWWEDLADLWHTRAAWRAWLRAHALTWGRLGRLLMGAGMAIAAPAGISLYAIYCWRAFGNPLMFLYAQQHYNEHTHSGVVAGIITAIQQWLSFASSSYPQARWLLDVVPLAACCIFTLATVRRIPFAYTLYLAGVCCVCLATPSIDAIFPDVYVSAGRYILIAFPLFITLGRWARTRGWLETLVINGGWAIQALLIVFLFNGGWLV